MVPENPLKSAAHHWWPRALAGYWADGEKLVSVIHHDGSVDRSQPGAYGAITNAHHIKLNSPFDTSFEGEFGQADTEISSLVRWLSEINPPRTSATDPLVMRINVQPLERENLLRLSRITASLLARSPMARNSIAFGIEKFREGFSDTPGKPEKQIIAANQQPLYGVFYKAMANSGRWGLLYSKETEFISGDGFYHNFNFVNHPPASGRKLILPILPHLAIAYMLPQGYPSEPKMVSIHLDKDEVSHINEVTQIYAKSFLFFREKPPIVTDAFQRNQHLALHESGQEWLNFFLDGLSQFTLHDNGQTPTIGGRRPFSEAMVQAAQLEELVNRNKQSRHQD
jgi:hypothetical protein